MAKRQRSNTSSFGFWRKPRPSDPASVSLGLPAGSLETFTPDTLIQSLTPPSVPSVNDARALCDILRTQTSPPSPTVITPIVTALCSTESLPSLQAAGFEILALYCKSATESFSLSDRMMYLDILRLGSGNWSAEVWEPRLSALKALFPSGLVSGSGRSIIHLLCSWIHTAFRGLLLFGSPGISFFERQERQRAIEKEADFIVSWFQNADNAASISDEDLEYLYHFLGGLFDQSCCIPLDAVTNLSIPTTPVQQQNPTTVFKHQHRKHPSSTSGITSPASSVASIPRPLIKHPAQLAAFIYLRYIDVQRTNCASSLTFLPLFFPTLLRIQGVFRSALPVLSPNAARPFHSDAPDTIQVLEAHLVKAITDLLRGPYSTRSIVLLKEQLVGLPPQDIANDPDIDLAQDICKRAKAAAGALRSIRMQVRGVLEDRLAALYISRGASSTATHAGTPGLMAFDDHLLDRAQRGWRKDGSELWDLSKIKLSLVRCIRAWIDWMPSVTGEGNHYTWKGAREIKMLKESREFVLEEIACILKDVFQEMNDAAEEDASDFKDEASAAGEILSELVSYVTVFRAEPLTILPLSRPFDAPTPLLRCLAELLAQDQSSSVTEPCISLILLHLTPHLSDADSVSIPSYLDEQQMLSPIFPDWLETWSKLFDSPSLFALSRPRTRKQIMDVLQKIHGEIKDMPVYRRPFVELVHKLWSKLVKDELDGDDGMLLWRILGEEVCLRAIEDDKDESFADTVEVQTPTSNINIQQIIDMLFTKAGMSEISRMPDESTAQSSESTPFSPITPLTPSNIASNTNSPTPARLHTDSPMQPKESGMPQLMSLLSFASGSNARIPLQSPALPPEESLIEVTSTAGVPQVAETPTPPPSSPVAAAVSLIDIFTQLVCSGRYAEERHLKLALVVFEDLLTLLRTSSCSRVRLTILQFLMCLRADRDHHVYVKQELRADPNVIRLATLIERDKIVKLEDLHAEDVGFDDLRSPRSRFPYPDRDGRRLSRGRGSRSSTTASRSRSRAPLRNPSIKASGSARTRETTWFLQDRLLFNMEGIIETSETMLTYDPSGPENKPVLLVSFYLDALVDIIKSEKDWEVLSFLLVHMPVQLANKHFWCGPMTREAMAEFVTTLCRRTLTSTLGTDVPMEAWTGNVRARDAQGLAYHSLGVLISYHNIFGTKGRSALVEVFHNGLSGSPSTILCCLQALSLSAFEFPQAVSRFLPRILQKMSQIMTNPAMAVHIINFLSNVASLPSLYANFTENDYKMVFGVALQYLQHHNRPETLTEISFALSQHVRIMSYHLIYVWFLAVKLPDRPRHVKFIARQLLLANEGRSDIDEPTEVCFDWLARYTYANADPKPAPSLLHHVVSSATQNPVDDEIISSKSWSMGHSIISVRTLARQGWLEVVARRASGTTQFLCKAENVPMVDLGDVEPDMVSLPAVLMMDRDPTIMRADDSTTHVADIHELFKEAEENEQPKPDPITGYVWSGSAPSQRRKQVDIDPSYFPLQLSSYPDIRAPTTRGQIIRDKEALERLIRTLDRLPVIDTHKVGILYVGPNQTNEAEILSNEYGSPAYTRFLKGLGRLIKVRGQKDVYVGGLEPDLDGEYAYAWWDDTGQILYHTATMMPTHDNDPNCNFKKRHIGNDFVRIVWNDSGLPYKFDTLSTQFQFVNIVVEPHSYGAIAAYSDDPHENEFFKLTLQKADGMAEFSPIGDFKIVSALSLPPLLRQISLQATWYASIFQDTKADTEQHEIVTNWRARLQTIKRFNASVPIANRPPEQDSGVMGQESVRDFTIAY